MVIMPLAGSVSWCEDREEGRTCEVTRAVNDNSLIFHFSPHLKKFVFAVINPHLRHFGLALLRV